jgi:hypothetical protein
MPRRAECHPLLGNGDVGLAFVVRADQRLDVDEVGVLCGGSCSAANLSIMAVNCVLVDALAEHVDSNQLREDDRLIMPAALDDPHAILRVVHLEP